MLLKADFSSQNQGLRAPLERAIEAAGAIILGDGGRELARVTF